MRRIDLHTHACFDDGKNTPEEMVKAAIALEMETIGIVVHSYTSFDTSYCVSIEGMKAFLSEMERLKELYADRIRVLAGVEQDLYSDFDTSGFDYAIGSVHYVKHRGEYVDVDLSADYFQEAVKSRFGGDYLLFAEEYYAAAATVLQVTGADFVGHLDLVTKFNEGGALFNESDPRYLTAAKACVDRLIPFGKPFEINTGAMHRGYRTAPYPSRVLRDYIHEKGGLLLLNSDAHSADKLMYRLQDYALEADERAYAWLDGEHVRAS